MSEPRFFWWPADELTYPWRLAMLGGDEYGRRTLGVRLPGGMLFVALWRFPEFRGPCARCGEWEHVDGWDGVHCRACASELADWAAGCICPSFRDAVDVDHESAFPAAGCPMHDSARSV